MTLAQQLWIGILTLMIVSFTGSFIVSNLSARDHLSEQLRHKNIDNANSLALTISSSSSDPVTTELLLSSQFDTGHYSYIEISGGPQPFHLGDSTPGIPDGVPRWFARWFSIDPPPGVAQLSDGWQSQGTLILKSEARFAYLALWRNTKRLCMYFSLVALCFGLLGSLLLRMITRPLGRVVSQATAIGERRFITIPEPRTEEFRALSRAMNALSLRVQQMITEESSRLAQSYSENIRDSLTGLLQREPFMVHLAALLKREDASAAGTLVLIRVMHLNELNRRHGRAVLDAVLARIGERLQAESEQHEGMLAARLNGSEFGVVVPEGPEPGELAAELHGALLAACAECSVDAPGIAVGATHYRFSDVLTSLLQRTDQALAAAEQRETGGIEIAASSVPLPRSSSDEIQHWTDTLDTAFGNDYFRLQTYPVQDRAGQLLHWEAPSRLELPDAEPVAAAQFMPWVARLGRMAELDLVVVRLAQKLILQTSEPIGVNLSARILEDSPELDRLVAQVASRPEVASRLWLEVPENGVYPRLTGFRRLCARLKPLGCRIGIEHAGPHVAQMGTLFDVGLDYVKLDAALIRHIDRNRGNQAFVRGFCTIVHSIGLRAIAEGVESLPEWQTLLGLGIDGGTGRFFAGAPIG